MVDEAGNPIGTAGAFLEDLKDYAGNDPQQDLHSGDFRALGRPGFDLVLQRLRQHQSAIPQSWADSRRRSKPLGRCGCFPSAIPEPDLY
jgi:hypothetical protein